MILKFSVTGMTCAACSARVEKVAGNTSGVKKAEVNLLAGKLTVDAEDASVADAVIEAISNAGYGVSLSGEKKPANENKSDNLWDMKRRIILSGVLLVILMYFTMGHMIGVPMPHWYHGKENALTAALLQFLLTLPVVYLNRVYYMRGFKALWQRSPNMDSLIAVGSGASLVYGVFALFRISYSMGHYDWDTVKLYSENLYFESAAMILTLITLGKFLEARAKGKTGDAIRKLMDLSPKTATVRYGDETKEIPVDAVKIGDVVVVRSGGSIPVDGVVLVGRGAVDQSALTGESVPVDKGVGDHVSAATINTEGYLEIRTEKTGEDTTLAQIIRMVEEAGGSKAPIARLADKIAGIFVPTVMLIAAVAFIIWLAIGQTFEFALTTAIAVLVISCPCALGLATPVAIMVGTGRGAGMGVLFKNAEALENLHNIDTVVLDKTGTLTVGKPAVTDVLSVSVAEEKLLSIAASLEARSEHLFAKAIMRYIGDIKYISADNFETLPGRGVCGTVDGVKYYGGNKHLMDDLGISVPDYTMLSERGKTPLYFASDDCFLGVIAAADVMKEDSTAAVAAMHNMHLKVVMLTGDNNQTAKAIAEGVNVDEIISDVLPADKALAVEKLQENGAKVLMVGDGINDAPALVTANVGMAIGAGTDVAIESADIVLMNNSLLDVCRAIELSKATIRNIRQNLFWAFFYNCLGIPIAAGLLYPLFQIQLSPMLGAAAMSFSSVFVVTNALRLRLFKSRIFPEEKRPEKEQMKEEINMQLIIYVEGMMCPHCKARVENVCKEIAGVTDAVVDLQAKNVTVTGNASLEALKKAISDAGYEVVD